MFILCSEINFHCLFDKEPSLYKPKMANSAHLAQYLYHLDDRHTYYRMLCIQKEINNKPFCLLLHFCAELNNVQY